MPARKAANLSKEARAVLALLPPTGFTPDFTGAYVGEIAVDLLGRGDSIARGRIRSLLFEIDSKVGYLRRHHHRGPAIYGQKVSYSIPADSWPKSKKLLRRGYALKLKP